MTNLYFSGKSIAFSIGNETLILDFQIESLDELLKVHAAIDNAKDFDFLSSPESILVWG